MNATLAAGGALTNLNFGYRPGAISGFAYVDANNNGMKDVGEPGLQGVTINGPTGPVVTDASGAYAFINLLSGNYSLVAPSAFGSYLLTTPSPLSGVMQPAQVIANQNFGYQLPPPPPTGSISGFTYIDANGNGQLDAGETKIGNILVTLGGTATSSVTTSTSGYSFSNLVAGSYSLSAAPTTVIGGFAYNLTTVSPLSVALAAGENRANVNFGYRMAIAYTTYTQGGWGASPAGNNPGTLLQNNFNTVYPTGAVIIGVPNVAGRYYLRFTSSTAIRNFLPTGGAPKVLKASAVNPTTCAAGVFAGQVLAVQLAVDFSSAGKITGGLKDLKIAPGNTLAGQTVMQVLALANQVLGGNTAALPAGVSLSMLNDVMTRINENFDNGTTNNGFLVP